MSVTQRLVREHPTLVLTLIYLGLTMVGLIHDWWFYLYFRINILNFSETSDFLLAAIRNPPVIILSMATVGLLLLFARFRNYALVRWPWYKAFSDKHRNSWTNRTGTQVVLYGFFVLVYTILFTQLYAQWEVSRIKAGIGWRAGVARADGDSLPERPIMLGSTTRFVFLYYPMRKVTEIIPVENMSVLTVDSRTRRERRRDSAAGVTRR